MLAVARQPEVDVLCLHIHLSYLHRDRLPKLEGLPGPLAHQLVMGFVKDIVVVAQLRHPDHPLHRVRKLHIEAPVGDPRDHALEGVADEAGHIRAFFQLVRLPFGLAGPPLQSGGLDRHLGEECVVMGDPVFRKPGL